MFGYRIDLIRETFAPENQHNKKAHHWIKFQFGLAIEISRFWLFADFYGERSMGKTCSNSVEVFGIAIMAHLKT